jgi:uncharacterized lipoprotein NlpE involved in copper resistance
MVTILVTGSGTCHVGCDSDPRCRGAAWNTRANEIFLAAIEFADSVARRATSTKTAATKAVGQQLTERTMFTGFGTMIAIRADHRRGWAVFRQQSAVAGVLHVAQLLSP